ncbi:hypothetical protein chiPu_0004126 [Chiloscyllium punctatum]|uniref:Uncharacterized protein n=1 Tax=Chiloscyllium punctatum TaxID=137246 RepID=A0A401S5Q3_CHIPU|nr:hypothetical protein [Chiloscyllium punctatum]
MSLGLLQPGSGRLPAFRQGFPLFGILPDAEGGMKREKANAAKSNRIVQPGSGNLPDAEAKLHVRLHGLWTGAEQHRNQEGTRRAAEAADRPVLILVMTVSWRGDFRHVV